MHTYVRRCYFICPQQILYKLTTNNIQKQDISLQWSQSVVNTQTLVTITTSNCYPTSPIQYAVSNIKICWHEIHLNIKMYASVISTTLASVNSKIPQHNAFSCCTNMIYTKWNWQWVQFPHSYYRSFSWLALT